MGTTQCCESTDQLQKFEAKPYMDSEPNFQDLKENSFYNNNINSSELSNQPYTINILKSSTMVTHKLPAFEAPDQMFMAIQDLINDNNFDQNSYQNNVLNSNNKTDLDRDTFSHKVDQNIVSKSLYKALTNNHEMINLEVINSKSFPTLNGKIFYISNEGLLGEDRLETTEDQSSGNTFRVGYQLLDSTWKCENRKYELTFLTKDESICQNGFCWEIFYDDSEIFTFCLRINQMDQKDQKLSLQNQVRLYYSVDGLHYLDKKQGLYFGKGTYVYLEIDESGVESQLVCKLLVAGSKQADVKVFSPKQEVVFIGSGADCDVRIRDNAEVAAKHCRILYEDFRWIFSNRVGPDQVSKQTLFVVGNQLVQLRDGMKIYFDDTELLVSSVIQI